MSPIRVVVRALGDDTSYNDCLYESLLREIGGCDDIFVNKYMRCFVRELQTWESIILYMIRLLSMFGGLI